MTGVWEAASAIGTWLAVIVALAFSYRALVDSRKVEKDRADLAAARMLGPVSALEDKISHLYAFLIFDIGEYEHSDPQVFDLLEEISFISSSITPEDLFQVLGLPKHSAKRMARALGLIHIFVGGAKHKLTQASWLEGKPKDKGSYYLRWASAVSEIRDHLQIVVRQFELAASTGAPRPSAEEIHGPGD